MYWNQISFEINKLEADLASEVLMGLGSISITYSDAHDDAIYEPPVGETPLWEFTRITALFKPEVSILTQLQGVGVIGAFVFVASFILWFILKKTVGIRHGD